MDDKLIKDIVKEVLGWKDKADNLEKENKELKLKIKELEDKISDLENNSCNIDPRSSQVDEDGNHLFWMPGDD